MGSNPLLQEVLADPDDLDARGVYADWLIESGNPRGSFIAAQIQLTVMTGLEDEYSPLYAEAERLKASHKGEWIDQLVDAVFADDVELREHQRFLLKERGEFENGFLDRLWLTPNQIEKYWNRVSECEPISGIELIVDEDAPLQLEAARSWRKLRLHRQGWFAGPVLARILNWPLDKLRQLDCGECDLGNLGARLLAKKETVLPKSEWPPIDLDLGQLTGLGLRGTNITDDETRMILASSEFSTLEILDLQDCRLSEDATFRALRWLDSLRELRLSVNDFPVDLVGWDGMSRLTHLALPATMTPKLLADVFPTPSESLRGLAGVGPSQVALNPQSFTEISIGFTDICLSVSPLGNEQFGAVVAANSMKTLRRLHAFSCSLDDEAIERLINKGPQSLVELDLCFNDLTDKTLHALASWEGARHIVSLNLAANNFTRDGYDALMNSKYLDPTKLDLGPIADDKVAGALSERFGESARFTLG